MSEINFDRYEIVDDALRLVCAVPRGWKARESVRAGEIDVQWLGPRNQADTYSTSLAIHCAPAAGRTAQAAAQALAVLWRSAAFETRGPTTVTVASWPAFRVECAYAAPLPLHSVLARPTPIQEATVFVGWGDRLIELQFAAPADDFTAWQPAFDTLLASLRVVESSPAVAIAVRDAREVYQTSRSEDDGSATGDGG